MGILDFLRKKKIQKEEIKLDEISFNEIETWLSQKARENTEKAKKVFNLVNERTNLFLSELNLKLNILKEIDIEAKKVEDRAKIIVKQSLEKYISYVNLFVEELKKLNSQEQEIKEFFKRVNKTFSYFEKHSYIFYQRSTYLVGDELVAVKHEMVNLSEYFTKLFNDNKKTLDSSEKISYVKLKLKKLDETKKNIKELESKTFSLGENITECEKKKGGILDKIEKTKKSGGYIKNLENKAEIENKEKELERDIWRLKELIDFKVLSNFFHSNEQQMSLVKDLKENFKTSFQKNKGRDLLSLLDEANIKKEQILEKIEEIKEKEKQLVIKKKEIMGDSTKPLYDEIQKLKIEVEDSNIEKVKHGKRLEKLNQTLGELKEEIKHNVAELGGVLV